MLERTLVVYCRSVRYVVWGIGRSVSLLMPLLASVVAFEVFARYVMNTPTIWAYDTSLFIFGYISALGGAYAQQKQSHINVDILYLKVPIVIRRCFSILTIVLAVGFLIVMTKLCFEKFLETYEYGFRRQSEWAPRVDHFWLMMAVASLIFIAEYSVQFIGHVFALITKRELIPGAYKEHEHAAQHQPDNADTKQANKSDNEEALTAKHAVATDNIVVGGSRGN
ncbi:TRAP transporter small permease subunit [Vibrio sp. ZSDZ34]|jgi:TRAP-type C4-dicarboxylate transport system permease small subunit|uniref:TRAP transporter small permease protein n=1 Tax=Vibrio gelatinilyticus TaxID=2893468 RepID=A0A9X2AYC0_9VIBR|nr:TRAP transporter small permease [Vibrio gelatinilyticus]MCJ2376498.1 TRAP transporter small permease subunit [Vibrio gelatinilyticus]